VNIAAGIKRRWTIWTRTDILECRMYSDFVQLVNSLYILTKVTYINQSFHTQIQCHCPIHKWGDPVWYKIGGHGPYFFSSSPSAVRQYGCPCKYYSVNFSAFSVAFWTVTVFLKGWVQVTTLRFRYRDVTNQYKTK